MSSNKQDNRELVKLVVFAPESHADQVREALGQSGAGKIGNYIYCTFSSKGIGRFIPSDGANPSVGESGRLEAVPEERIETVCYKDELVKIMRAVKRVHPYEEAPFDVFPITMY